MEKMRTEFESYKGIYDSSAESPVNGYYGLFEFSKDPNRGFLVVEAFGTVIKKSFLTFPRDLK